MTEVSKLSKLLEKNRVELNTMAQKSIGWFEQKARELLKQSNDPMKLMRGDVEDKTGTVIPGSMYMFVYDPIHKETLPYYDTFPLVLPFNKQGQYIWGLNLHYLPYHLRIRLLDRLYDIGTIGTDKTKRLRLQWEFISNSSKLQMIMPCVKQYHLGHVRTPFKRIDSIDWATVSILPSEQFVKSSKQEVWADSLRIIKGMQ